MRHQSGRHSLPSLALAIFASALVTPMMFPLAARAAVGGAAELAPSAVARLSFVDGSVTIARGDANTRIDAVVNTPVRAADYVTTGARSRAEVQFDGTTLVRLGANVQMRFAHVDAGNRALQVAAGTIDVRLLHGTDGRTSIDTPSISVVPRASGTYRVTVDNDGTTFVTVRDGHADIDTPQGAQPLDPGTTLVAQGTASDPHLSTRDAIAYDSFDAFNADRDREAQNAVADAPSVNNAGGGASDLGAYGQWAYDGSYGQVWMPNDVAVGWAPYPLIVAEPWGWAPYHSGRWYFSTAYNRWAWLPPARAPSYAQRAPSYARTAALPSYGGRYGYAPPAYGSRPGYAQPTYSRPAYQQRGAPARQSVASRGRAEGRYR